MTQHKIGDKALCSLCAGVESPGFYTGCMVKDGHCEEWTCDGSGNLIYIGFPNERTQKANTEQSE
jgi:hypothetical protein